MAQFPETESEIAALAALVADGLEHAAADFPTPPVPPAELQAKLDRYAQARAATVVAETAFREAAERRANLGGSGRLLGGDTRKRSAVSEGQRPPTVLRRGKLCPGTPGVWRQHV